MNQPPALPGRAVFSEKFSLFQTFSLPQASVRQKETERTMNVTHVTERQLTVFLVENQERFYRLAYSYLQDREEALDAVQTAVCRALERQDSLREADAMRTWFYRILVNVCMDALRRRKLVTLVPPEALDTGSYEDPLPADEDLAKRVEALPPEVATIVKLRFYEELSLKEISAVTGCNLSTVKTRLYTGLKKLRVSMEGANET